MRIILNLFFFIIVCSFCSCKTSSSDPNVVNGLVDKNNRYKAVVPIEVTYKDEEGDTHEGICSASVISSNTLLTVAHCLYNKETNKPRDSVSVVFTTPEEKKIKAKAFYFMDEYTKIISGDDDRKRVEKDIGIVVFNDRIFEGTTPLKISNKELKKEDLIIHVGYGAETDLSEEEDDGFGNKLTLIVNKDPIRRYGVNKIYDFDCEDGLECIIARSRLENSYLDPNKRIDAQGFNSTTWSGDSGGPILSYDNDNLIVGIISGEWVEKDEEDNYSYHYSYAFKFNQSSIEWLKKINRRTKANIPLDGIK